MSVMDDSTFGAEATSTDETESRPPGTPLSLFFIIFNEILLAVCFVFILSGNLLTIISVYKFNWMHSNSNYLVAKLAIADLALSLGIVGHMVMRFLPVPEKGSILYLVYIFVFNSLYFGAFLHLLAIGVDRVVAVVRPLQYLNWIVRFTPGVLSALAWSMSLALSLTLIVVLIKGQNIDAEKIMSWFHMAWFLIICSILLVLYMRLTIVAKKHRQQIAMLQVSSTTQGGPSGENGSHVSCAEIDISKDKATTMMIVVLAAFALLCGPWFIFNFVTAGLGVATSPDYKSYLYVVCAFLLHCNSAINPIIYGYMNRKFRLAFRTLAYSLFHIECLNVKLDELDPTTTC